MRHVLIIEDHPFVSGATADLLTSLDTSVVPKLAQTATEAQVALSEKRDWNLILLDLDVPGANGLSLGREIAALGFAGKACIVSAFQKPAYIAEARTLGFLGFISKAYSLEQFNTAIRLVLKGETVFPETALERAPSVPLLTRQQLKVLQLIGEGMTSKHVARALSISEGTVNNHVTAALRALGVTGRLAGYRRALEFGLVDEPKGKLSAEVNDTYTTS